MGYTVQLLINIFLLLHNCTFLVVILAKTDQPKHRKSFILYIVIVTVGLIPRRTSHLLVIQRGNCVDISFNFIAEKLSIKGRI